MSPSRRHDGRPRRVHLRARRHFKSRPVAGGDVRLQPVVEEEITDNGAATLFAESFTADVVVSPEPTDEQLVRANAGVIKFRLETRGRAAHPRKPESGQSAIGLSSLRQRHQDAGTLRRRLVRRAGTLGSTGLPTFQPGLPQGF